MIDSDGNGGKIASVTPEIASQKKIFDFLMGSQFWSAERLITYQRSQLGQLLRFAHAHIPFYRERLKPVMRGDGNIDWERWQDVPILKRQDLLDHREAMQATALPPGHGAVVEHAGSGTTGTPVVTRHNRLTSIASHAAMYRAFYWHGEDFSKTMCFPFGHKPDIAAWPDGSNRGLWGPPWEAKSAQGKLLVINRFASGEQIVEFMVRNNARYLNGWAERMQALALTAEAMGVSHRLERIFTTGSTISDAAREDCKRVFGAQFHALYSSKEVYNIAHQCPSGQHYHINSELVQAEVLDQNDQPCPPGVAGRAVVTQFFNTAQPFIRYEIGDQIVMGGACNCGRHLPVIERIEGRIVHLFRFPGRQPTALSVNPKHLRLIGARSWQFAQVSPLGLEVRYVSDESHRTPDFAGMTQVLRDLGDPRLEVTYRQCESLPLAPSGKFIEYVCELPASAIKIDSSAI